MNPIGSVPQVPSARGPQVRAPGTGSSTSPPSLATPSLGLPQRQKEKMESAYTGSRQGLRSLLSDTEASSFLGSPLAKGTSQLSLKYGLGPLPGAGSAILQTSRKSWIPHDKSSHKVIKGFVQQTVLLWGPHGRVSLQAKATFMGYEWTEIHRHARAAPSRNTPDEA